MLFHLEPEYISLGTKKQMWELWLGKFLDLFKITPIFAILGSSTRAYKNGSFTLEVDNVLSVLGIFRQGSVLLFSHLVVSNSLWPHGLHHTKLPCPSPSPRVCSNSCPLSQWCHQTSHLLSPSFPPVLNLSQQQGCFQWVGYSQQMAKVLELQHQHQSFQWILRTDLL